MCFFQTRCVTGLPNYEVFLIFDRITRLVLWFYTVMFSLKVFARSISWKEGFLKTGNEIFNHKFPWYLKKGDISSVSLNFCISSLLQKKHFNFMWKYYVERAEPNRCVSWDQHVKMSCTCLKQKIHYPFKWIQLIEWFHYLNMNNCLHLSNKLMMIMMIIVFVVWLTDERRLALFPAGTIVRDPHHRESSTRREQGLNLRRTWIQA